MDIELESKFRIAKVDLKVTEKDAHVFRTCVIKLEADLDPMLAKALGGDAPAILKLLKGQGTTKAELPIDGLLAHATFKANDAKVKVPALHGVKAVASAIAGDPDERTERDEKKAADEDREEPSPIARPSGAAIVAITWECPYNRDLWMFLGDNGGGWAEVTFKPTQESMKFPGPRAA